MQVQVHYAHGIELPAHNLWLDPQKPRPFAFVSHAHSDHIGNHGIVIASHATARLMSERLPKRLKNGQFRQEHLLFFGETVPMPEQPGTSIQLLPAGHIFGSAQLYLESDAGSLLYTGDFKLRPGLAAEPTEWRHAETLVMETTFGLPRYRFPPTAQVLSQVVDFCRLALEEKSVPILFGYSLGKAQEIIFALCNAGLTPMLHSAVFRMTEIYRELYPSFPNRYQPYHAASIAGKVLLWPPNAAKSPSILRITNRRTAMLTGWALDSSARYRYGVETVFPLSDHADYDDLIKYVELVNPHRVLTLHGFSAEFAADLRRRGVEAWALNAQNQMELTF